MTIDISRFELRVVQFDPENPKLGIWDKQKERYTGEYAFTLEEGKALLKKTIHAPQLVYKKLTETINWQQISRWDHTKEKFYFAPELNQSYPYKKLEDIPKANGAIVEIIKLVKTTFRCEFEK